MVITRNAQTACLPFANVGQNNPSTGTNPCKTVDAFPERRAAALSDLPGVSADEATVHQGARPFQDISTGAGQLACAAARD